MEQILIFVVGAIVGGVITGLVYHNNQSAANKAISDAQALAAKAQADAAAAKAAAAKLGVKL